MRLPGRVAKILIFAVAVCASSGAAADDTLSQIKQQIDALKQQGKFTVNSGSLAIESWLLTSTAIEATADKIQTAVSATGLSDLNKPILVLAGTEALDFGQVAMLEFEMKALTERLQTVCRCTRMRTQTLPAIFGMVAGLLKSDTELTAIEQTVDAKLLAAAVAGKIPNAILPAAAIASDTGGDLIHSFNVLAIAADDAQLEVESLSAIPKPTPVEKHKLELLKRLLARYDSFHTRTTTPNQNGVVPLAAAARLQQLMEGNPYVLRVNTEKAGGTLLKRTNLLTALGAETAFVSGGLVSSYQLTEPQSGKVVKVGVITCRTALTSLKRVQEASWKSLPSNLPAANCSP